MKRITLFAVSISIALPLIALPQSQQVAAASEQKTLAATMNVYVFPAEGQTPEVQNRQEAECYAWAVNNTKIDPFDLQRQAEQQIQTADQQKAAVQAAGQGAGAKGALVGAATGALIGEIADNDPGRGAAWGAAGGMVAARRVRRRKQEQANQQIDQQTQQVQQVTAEQIEGFKKAFSICLEAKEYMVKM